MKVRYYKTWDTKRKGQYLCHGCSYCMACPYRDCTDQCIFCKEKCKYYKIREEESEKS